MKYIAFQLFWLCLFYVFKRKAAQASGSGLENVQGTSISYDSILVSWKSPTASPSPKPLFKITYKSSRRDRAVAQTSQHEALLKGLKPNANYTITVVRCLATGDCQKSATIVVKTKKASQTSTPRHFQGIVLGSSRIKLSWLKPSNIFGKLKRYHIISTEENILHPKGESAINEKERRKKYIIDDPSENETVISGLKPYTNYTFTIAAITEFGKGKRSSSITVRTDEAASPRVIPPHSVVFAKEGFPIKLPCHYQGYPEPNITWMFNGQRMKPTSHNVTITNFESNKRRNVKKVSKLLSDGSWHISSVEEHEDGGVYSCVVTNEHGTATGYVSVLVSEEPIAIGFEIKLMNEVFRKELAEKDSISFENLADNVSTAVKSLFEEAGNISIIAIDVLNFRKGSVIAEVEILAVSRIEDDEDLVIKVVREKLEKMLKNGTQGNLGKFNVGGLELHEPPLAPRDVRVDVTEPTAITVSWSPPEHHTMSAIRNYTILYRKFETETFLAGTVTNSETLKANIINLTKETAYEIKVKVSNNYGYAISEPLEVKTRTAKGTGLRTMSAFDSLLLIILVGVACCLVLMCTLCGVLLLCRTIAAKIRIENTCTTLELNQIEGNSTQEVPQLDSPHFYVNLSSAESDHFRMVPTQHVRGKPKQWREIPRNMIRFHGDLGKGAFCEVKKGSLVKDDRALPCAIKMLKGCATEIEFRDLVNELNIMATIGNHPNIVSLIGACTTDGPLWLVVKLAENGSLLDYLHHHRVNSGKENSLSPEIDLSYGDKLGLARGITKGMRHLESIKCVHRDLACRNILLGKNNIPKISDFGLSCDISESGQYEYTEEGRLPTRWMAIESLLDYSFTVKSDVWSFGVVLWEVESAGRVPFPAMNGMEILEVLLGGYRLKKPAGCSNEIYDIMKTCWQVDPNKRPTFQDLVVVLEGLLSSTKDALYHGNCRASETQLEEDNIDTFFEDFTQLSENDTPSGREHTYVNIGAKCQISSDAGESLTATDPVAPGTISKPPLLDERSRSKSLPGRGSSDTIISIHDLPNDPPQVPSYDRLLSMKTSPQNSPKPPSYDRLLSFKGSPKIPRCSTYANGCPPRIRPGCAKQRLEPEQSCYDRLERWFNGIPEPNDTKGGTFNRLWLRKGSSPQITVDQSASQTVESRGKDTCHLYPGPSQVLNEQGLCDKIPGMAPDTKVCQQSHSGDLPRVAPIKGNDKTKRGARSSSLPSLLLDPTVDNNGDMCHSDNAPEVIHFSDASYDKLSLNRSFKDKHYDANSLYNRLCTDGSHAEKTSCLNGRSLQRSTPSLLCDDSNGANYYSRIRDSGIVCEDCYCGIDLSSNHSDTCDAKILQDGDAIYDTIGNENGFSEEVECGDESNAESIYATINFYDSATENLHVQIYSDGAEEKVTDPTVSDVACSDCNPVEDLQSNDGFVKQCDTYKTKPKNLQIPDKLSTANVAQDYGGTLEDKGKRALGNGSEALTKETTREDCTTKSCRNSEKFTVDEKLSETTESDKSLHDKIFEMLRDTQGSK